MPDPDATIVVMGGKDIATVHDRLFGQFFELTGRCINNGLYEPASPHARPDGVRADVLEALRELRPGYIRYPGGCGAAYFAWQELVGPVEDRPLTVRLDLHGLTPQGRQMTFHRLTGGENLFAENTLDCPDRVGIETMRVPLTTTLTLVPASLTVLEMDLLGARSK